MKNDSYYSKTIYYVSFKSGVPVLNVLNNAYILFSIWLFVDLAKDTKRPCVSYCIPWRLI